MLASDDFASGAAIPGRAGWTARPTSPLNRSGGAITPITSAGVVHDGRLYSNTSNQYADLMTQSVGTPDADASVNVETWEGAASGAGLLVRWTSTAWLLGLLAIDNSGNWRAQLVRETTGPSARVDLVDVLVGGPTWPVSPSVRVRALGSALSLYYRHAVTDDWTFAGSAVDSTGIASTQHGVTLYYATNNGWGLADWLVEAPVTEGGWAVGLVS